MDRDLRIIKELCDRAPKVIKEYVGGRLDTCLLSTAVGLDVLAHFGIEAQASKLQTTVFNKKYVQRMDREGKLPENQKELDRWIADGCFSMGLGHRERDRLGIHVGIITKTDPIYLIDLALEQANRPKYKIKLEAAYGPVSQAFAQGQEQEHFVTESPSCLITYDAFPFDTFYQEAPGWKDKAPRKMLTNRIITITQIALRGRI